MRSLTLLLLLPVLLCGRAIAPAAAAYDTVRIVAPPQESTVHDNNGDIAVRVEAVPPLDRCRGTASSSGALFAARIPCRRESRLRTARRSPRPRP
jgi:hypothetical protein